MRHANHPTQGQRSTVVSFLASTQPTIDPSVCHIYGAKNPILGYKMKKMYVFWEGSVPSNFTQNQNNHTETILIKTLLGPLALASY